VNSPEPQKKGLLSNFTVDQEAFRGPFDVLLHLIENDEITVDQISISAITKKFVEFILQAEKIDMDGASEFLFLCAHLIEKKSKLMLPKVEDEGFADELGSIEGDLVDRLAQYRTFKEAAASLKERKALFERVYARYGRIYEEGKVGSNKVVLINVSLVDLVSAFKRLWDAVGEEEEGIREIEAEEIKVEDRVVEIMEMLSKESPLPFVKLFPRLTRMQIMVTFLAMLELMKSNSISARQGETFGEILIFKN